MKYEAFQEISDDVLSEIAECENLAFEEPLSKDQIEKHLKHRHNILILIAYDNDKPIGFKVGYEHSNNVYYSWAGGVAASHRQQGIAQELMLKQHRFAKGRGYKVIRTKTTNEFKNMIILNLKNGFDICGTVQNLGQSYSMIIMDKNL